jgi:DNA-binding SARP family transcriptional activator/tetratricopeptide (TPR) repeat protein
VVYACQSVDVLLLGPLEVRHDDVPIVLGRRRRERCLLGLLLLDPGRVVSVDRLQDLLWDDAEPTTAAAVLKTHVARLRSVLDPDRDGRYGLRIVRRGDGYVAEIDPSSVDVQRFRSLVDRARSERAPDRRAALLRQALAAWRGPLLEDVATDRLRDRIGTGLEELRQSALDACFEAELACGRHAELISELTDLVEAYPLRQSLSAALMLALYRDGRQADALDVYRRLQSRLAEELGLDVSTDLRQLGDAVLRGDADLDLSAADGHRAAADARSGPASRPPALLPLDGYGFVGRAEHLDLLDDVAARVDRQPTAVPVSVISGLPGMGKTTLAVHWGHRAAERFPDGQLYVNLRGFDPGGLPLEPAEAIRIFLDAFEVPRGRVPADPQAQAGLYRSLVAGRRLLIILDNARDAEQVRALLPGGAGCVVVVTSRDPLSGLVAGAGARPVLLGELSHPEAEQLLAQRIGGERLTAEPSATEAIINRSGRLPLALAVVAARAAIHPGVPLATLADELHHTLDALADADPTTDVRTVLSWSYGVLDADAARLFRLLGVAPGPDVSVAAAASLVGVPAPRGRELLAELCRVHLLTEQPAGRYALHDVLRAYAIELADRHETEGGRRRAVLRVLDHYVQTGYVAARLADPYRSAVPVDDPAPGVTPEEIVDARAALAWFRTEHNALLTATHHAEASGFDAQACWLAWTLVNVLDRNGYWHEQAATQHAALRAATRLADRYMRAESHRGLGRALTMLGDHSGADVHFTAALEIAGELADTVHEGLIRRNRALLREVQGRYRDAIGEAQRAIDLFRAAGHRMGLANTLNQLGWYHTLVGEHDVALVHLRPALAMLEEDDHRAGQAHTLDSIGYAHLQLADHEQAIDCLRRSTALFADEGDRYYQAMALGHLGDAHLADGDRDLARRAWRTAFEILEALDHRDADELRGKLRDIETPEPVD